MGPFTKASLCVTMFGLGGVAGWLVYESFSVGIINGFIAIALIGAGSLWVSALLES
jgi:hypothetical protein